MLKWFLNLFKPVYVKDATYDGKIMVVNYTDGSQQHFKGSVTVWHEYPLMERCGTSQEALLCEIYTYIKEHGNPYPTAHLKRKI